MLARRLLRSLVVLADVGGAPFHVGDEAMLAANLGMLRREDPSAHLTVLGRGPGADGDPQALAAVFEGATGLFLSGGGNLSSSWPGLLRQRILVLREARRRGLPVVTGGQTIGPALSPLERDGLTEALAGVGHLGVREIPSLALAIQMAVPAERLWYQPDDAFFLAGRPPTAEEVPVPPEEPFLAITLDPAFQSSLAALAVQLGRISIESGLRCVFLPHVGPLGHLGDEDGGIGTALSRALEAQGVACTLLPVLPPEPVAWITQRASFVVSSRYHPLVFGTAAGIPCLGIERDAYTRIKLQGALAHGGLEDGCLSASAAESGGLLEAFRRLWSRRAEVQAVLTEARAVLVRSEEARWLRVWERLGWRAPSGAPPGEELFGRPSGPLVVEVLRSLTRERQAADADTGRWLSIVKHLERSAGAPGRSLPHRRQRSPEMCSMLTEEQWNDYSRDGFLPLGKVLDGAELEALKQRADDLALGHVRNPNVQMQLDTGGSYEELPAVVDSFAKGTILYRKIQGLEADELFSRLVKHPLFLEVCDRQYGRHAPISIFRAMVMNKPAGQGTILPWHQDGGDVWSLDRDPLVTVWVALDPTTRSNGCLEVIPGTHRLGLLTLYGSTLEEEAVERHCLPDRVLPLEVEAGHAVLLHNWLIHRSGVNPSSVPRRAFTTCYMDGRTQSTLTGASFPLIAGTLPAEPYPFIRHLREENQALRQMREEAERYAKSLEAERQSRLSRIRGLGRLKRLFGRV